MLTQLPLVVLVVPSSTTTTYRQVTIELTSTVKAPTGTRISRDSRDAGPGLSLSDKIALGVGIGIGLPAAVASVAACCMMMAGRR